MTIAAVVPTCNRKNEIALCLGALLRQTRPLDEIIVVDNASTDGTDRLIAQQFGGRTTYVRLSENRGGAGGFHHGMKLAHAHGHAWIWCLDSDGMPADDALQRLCEAEAASSLPVVALTCTQRDPVTGDCWAGGDMLDFRLSREMHYNEPGWQAAIRSIDLAYGGCLLVRSEAAAKANFFREDFFLYYDDLIFSLAINKMGRILHVGTTCFFHPAADSRFRFVTRRRRRRIDVRDYWKQYYLLRNGYVFRKQCFGTRRMLPRYLLQYVRLMAGICALDDFPRYRLKILTKALIDGLLGRLGKRVDPEDVGVRAGAGTGERHARQGACN